MLVEEAFAARGLKLRVSMQVAGTEAVKKAVEADLGVAMVSRHAVQRELATGALRRVAVQELAIHRAIHLLYRKGKHLTALAQRFLEFALEHGVEQQGAPAFGVVRPSR